MSGGGLARPGGLHTLLSISGLEGSAQFAEGIPRLGHVGCALTRKREVVQTPCRAARGPETGNGNPGSVLYFSTISHR